MMDMNEWLRMGWANGWCSGPVCPTHDGVPLSESEFEDDEPCLSVVRLFFTEEERLAVIADHAPSTWRATNLWGSDAEEA